MATGCGPLALAYNSDTVNVRPIVEATYADNPAGSAPPTSIQVTLTWNGTLQSPVTFQTTGHSVGDTYLLAVQVASAVLNTGLYPYTLDVLASYSGTPATVEWLLSGTAQVVVNTNSPYGAGWSLVGQDSLVPVTGGVLWVSGS